MAFSSRDFAVGKEDRLFFSGLVNLVSCHPFSDPQRERCSPNAFFYKSKNCVRGTQASFSKQIGNACYFVCEFSNYHFPTLTPVGRRSRVYNSRDFFFFFFFPAGSLLGVSRVLCVARLVCGGFLVVRLFPSLILPGRPTIAAVSSCAFLQACTTSLCVLEFIRQR